MILKFDGLNRRVFLRYWMGGIKKRLDEVHRHFYSNKLLEE